MVVVRRIDTEATALQRQGELGLWAPLLGQEAAQVGSARTHSPRRLRLLQLPRTRRRVLPWRDPRHVRRVARRRRLRLGPVRDQHDDPADRRRRAGAARHRVRDGRPVRRRRDAAVAYFGDGATSQGDIAEAMVFAASCGAPVVFFCQNNQWAISEPVRLQSVTPLATSNT